MTFLKYKLLLISLLFSPSIFGQGFPEEDPSLIPLRTVCAPENMEVFGLKPLSTPVDLTQLDWHPIWRDSKPFYVTPNSENNLKLIVCEQRDGTYRIHSVEHRLLFLNTDVEFQFNINKSYQESYWNYLGKGLDNALFGGPEDLRLFVNGPLVNEGLMIKGWKVGGTSFVTVSMTMLSDNVFYHHVPAILVGQLEYGNPFPEESVTDCLFRSHPFVDRYLLGTATLELRGCSFQGVGSSALKSVSYVRVKDTNEAIPENFRGKDVIIQGDDLRDKFSYKNSHHNWCDGFYVDVPQLNATYFMTGDIVEDFPKVNGERFAGSAVRYGEIWSILNKIENGSGPCY